MLVLILDMYYQVYLMMDILLLWFNVNVIYLGNISCFCHQIASRSYETACISMFQRLCLQWMSGVV